jgi:hypothetical protein
MSKIIFLENQFRIVIRGRACLKIFWCRMPIFNIEDFSGYNFIALAGRRCTDIFIGCDIKI